MKFEKGKAKEIPQARKVELGLRNSINGLAGCVCWPSDLVISEMIPTQIGTAEKPCERIMAQGTLTINRRDAESGEILMPKKSVVFSIEVEDRKDEWGLPDVKTNKFALK